MGTDDLEIERFKKQRKFRHIILYDLLRIMVDIYSRFDNPFRNGNGVYDHEKDAYVIYENGIRTFEDRTFDYINEIKARLCENGTIEIFFETKDSEDDYSLTKYIINPNTILNGSFIRVSYFEDENGNPLTAEEEIKSDELEDDKLQTLFFNLFKSFVHQILQVSKYRSELEKIPGQEDFLIDNNLKRDLILTALRLLKIKIEQGLTKSLDQIAWKTLHFDNIHVPTIMYDGYKFYWNEDGDLFLHKYRINEPINNDKLNIRVYSDPRTISMNSRKLSQYVLSNQDLLMEGFQKRSFDDFVAKIYNGEEAYYQAELQTIRIPSFLSNHAPGVDLEFYYLRRELLDNGDTIITEETCDLSNPTHELVAMIFDMLS